MAWIRQRGKKFYVYWREAGQERSEAWPDRKDARRAKHEIEGRLMKGAVIRHRIAFAEFAEEWQQMRMDGKRVRTKTLDTERGLLKKHLIPAFGPVKLHDISTEQVEKFLGKLAGSVSAYTARRAHDVLRKMLQDAVRREYLWRNPAWGVERPALPHREMRVLSVKDACRMLEALPQRYAPLVLTAMLTGMRWGELAGMEWADIDFGVGKIHVRRQIAANTKEKAAPKSRAGLRSIDMLPPVREALVRQASAKLFPVEGDVPMIAENMLHAPVFEITSVGHTPVHHNFIVRVWNPTIRALALNVRFHDLRHFRASLAAAWGEFENPVWVAAQMGHTSADVTLRVYAHLLREGRRLDKDETLKRLTEAFRSAGSLRPLIAAASLGHTRPRRWPEVS